MEGKKITGIHTTRGDFACRWVVNAAGLYADEVMHTAGVRPEFQITARRGEYAILDRAEITINNVLFPVPSDICKGILVTATLHGNTLVGPNAENLPEKEDHSVSPGGMAEIWEGAKRLIPDLQPKHPSPSSPGCGLAATPPARRPGSTMTTTL